MRVEVRRQPWVACFRIDHFLLEMGWVPHWARAQSGLCRLPVALGGGPQDPPVPLPGPGVRGCASVRPHPWLPLTVWDGTIELQIPSVVGTAATNTTVFQSAFSVCWPVGATGDLSGFPDPWLVKRAALESVRPALSSEKHWEGWAPCCSR